MKKALDAQIFTRRGDGVLFGFIKQFPAAAASATDMETLISRLKNALSEVIVYEDYNLTYRNVESL